MSAVSADYEYRRRKWMLEGSELPEMGLNNKIEQEKLRVPYEELYRDSLGVHPDKPGKIEVDPTMFQVPPAPKVPATGWNNVDTIEMSARPPVATQSAAVAAPTKDSTRPSQSWLNVIGNTSNKAVDWVKGWFGAASNAVTEAKSHVQESAYSLLAPFLPYFQPENVISGAKEMAKGLWDTITFADKSFKDPSVQSIEIPKLNVDGTHNPFGGRRINRADYIELQNFNSDVSELLEHMAALSKSIGCEALLVALMKAMVKDKQDDFEFLKVQLSDAYKDREIDVKLRLAASQKLIEKIKSNRWYDWFFEATTHTTLAFTGVALGAVTGGWGWPVVLIAFAGIGISNMASGHMIEKGLAAISSKITGGNKTAHKEGWQVAHNLVMGLMSLAVGSWSGAAASGQAVLKVVMGLSSITRNIGGFRKAQLQHQKGKAEGELNYRADRIGTAEKEIQEKIRNLGTAYSNFTNLYRDQSRRNQQAQQTIQSIFRK
ncbi:MAG: hypothetical protein Q8K75_00935 [Chlamydiales bacterium]|nr:hypothetical protein [Chlamydiales bacterium]